MSLTDLSEEKLQAMFDMAITKQCVGSYVSFAAQIGEILGVVPEAVANEVAGETFAAEYAKHAGLLLAYLPDITEAANKLKCSQAMVRMEALQQYKSSLHAMVTKFTKAKDEKITQLEEKIKELEEENFKLKKAKK